MTESISRGYAALLKRRRVLEQELNVLNESIREYVNRYNLNKDPEWPPTDERIQRIGQDGGTGEHYE